MEDFENVYQELIKKCSLRQNGEVVDIMKQAGIDKEASYGLSVRDIKKLATTFSSSNQLAFYLLDKPLREARLLALYLFNPKKLDTASARRIGKQINTVEMAEQTARIVLPEIPDSEQIMHSFCQSSNDFEKMTGFLLLAQLSLLHEFENEDKIFELIEKAAVNATSLTMRSISMAIRKFYSRNEKSRLNGIQLISSLRLSESYTVKWIAEESSIELDQ